MKIYRSIESLQEALASIRQEQKEVGFVPTMGYLHDGHLSLVKLSLEACQVTLVSIFVNPTQFGPGEDLEAYPRDEKRDIGLLEEAGVDMVFIPSVEEMYPRGYATYVEVEDEMTQQLCGAKRPGHFKGVTTIVTKLFNLVRPDKAFFGQKDAQQVAVIKKMVKDLNIPVDIVAGPILREPDGLAMSSRNVYLDEDQREQALVLSRSLQLAKELIAAGEGDPNQIRQKMEALIAKAPQARIDYIDLVDVETLMPLTRLDDKVLIALAVYIGKTRLIDNIVVEV